MALEFDNPSSLMSFNNLLNIGMGGQPMTMADAVVMQEKQRDAARTEQLQQALPSLLEQVDVNDPMGSISRLVAKGVEVKNAEGVVGIALRSHEAKLRQKEMEEKQRVMGGIGNLLGGGYGTPPFVDGGGKTAGIPTPPLVDSGASDPGFETALNTVLETEGGYVANDAGKGPTNMGINVTANPDVDVANLDRAQAAKIYKERYWDAIGADKLPPQTAMVAFDAAVNHGPAKAKELLQASGGDPQKLIELRRQEYQRLVEANPQKYGQFAAGWEDRLNRLQAGIGQQPEPPARTGRDPAKLAQAGAMMAAAGIDGGNTLIQLANFEQQQQNRAEDKESKRTENRVAGYDIAPDAAPAADDAKKMKQITLAQANLKRLNERMQKLVNIHGIQPVGKAADAMGQVYEQMKLQIKNLEDLGAIQAPDVPIIEGIVPNPTSWREYAKAQADAAAGNGKPFDAVQSVKDRLASLDAELAARVDEAAGVYGYTPKGRAPFQRVIPDAEPDVVIPAGPKGLPAPQTQEQFNMLPKGTRFVDPNGVERIKP